MPQLQKLYSPRPPDAKASMDRPVVDALRLSTLLSSHTYVRIPHVLAYPSFTKRIKRNLGNVTSGVT